MKTFLKLTADLLLFFMTLTLTGIMFASFYGRHEVTDKSLLQVISFVTILLGVYILCKIAIYSMNNFKLTKLN